ncbi:MAG: MBL fold metallo-hydrolase [Gallionellaceae bacterium]|nr:MAG: MBL fold metallo-hydrolase [Gallionellaceae bacterium]
MATLKIIRIPILPFRMVNCFLILGEEGCVLVDTGLPGSEAKIGRALKKHSLAFNDIKLIVITHAHVDHAGSAARMRELSGAPIVAHEGDLKHYLREVPMTFCPTGWFSHLFKATGLILQPYTPFKPDFLLTNDEVMDINRYGIHGFVKHTPGHTAGSITVELNTMDAMVGDLVASGILIGGIVRTKHAIRPPFEDDPHAVAAQLQRLIDSGMERFYMGHGGPLKADEVQRHVRTLMALGRLKEGS